MVVGLVMLEGVLVVGFYEVFSKKVNVLMVGF